MNLPRTEFHFALKVIDEAGNTSGLSNNEIATTLTSPWLTRVINDSGRTGFWHSIAVNPDSDTPAIAYSEDSTSNVIFAQWDGQAWNKVVVAGSARAGVSLAFDPIWQNPAISHSWGKLYFSQRNEGSWSTELVDGKASKDNETSMAYDLDGNPCIAYRSLLGKANDLKIACNYGSGWEIQYVQRVSLASDISLAFDPENSPVIAYSGDSDGDNRIDSIKYAFLDNGIWVDEVIDSGRSSCASLVIDPVTGQRMVADTADGMIRFYHSNVGEATWTKVVVSEGRRTNLAINDEGTPYISFATFDPDTMKIAQPATPESYDSWEIQVVENFDVRWRTSIDTKSSGFPVVSYGDFGDFVNYTLKWAERREEP